MDDLRYQLDLALAMNQKLTEKERIYQMVCASDIGAFLYCSLSKKQYTMLGKWEQFFDFEVKESKDLSRFLDIVDENSVTELQELLFLERTGQESGKLECLLKDSGKWYRFLVTITYDDRGIPIEKLIQVSDVSVFYAQNEELTNMAYYDSLTGLYNRNYFVRLLSEFVREASETHNIVSVMILDVDDFRKVNDGQGIVAGDELVQQIGFFVKELCGDSVIACHVHSDLFGIAIYAPTAQNCADAIYKRIQERLKMPFLLSSGQEIKVTMSVGVAEYPEAATTSLELINCAEIILFKSKAMGKNTMQYFNVPVLNDFLNAIELENKLKTAIRNEEFMMYYQPQYFAASRQLRGVEALIRWPDENAKFISPAVFIPVAEKNGSIIPIGKWVLEQSVKQYAAWREQFGFPFIMSINISALQYKKDDFVDNVIEILNKYDVAPYEIELEITESVLIENFDVVCEKIKTLRAYGIRISLDDFGTGFSSLSYLKKFPIDTLKIDKTFIDTVLTDNNSKVIMEAIVNMVKALGFESIAEGVEEKEQYMYLRSIGCDVIQGYWFSKPLAPKDMEMVLEKIQ